MRIDIITVLPELLEGPFAHSILKRAKDKGLAEVHVHQLREFGAGKHQQVDDYQYGGGAGMVMKAEPIFDAVEAAAPPRPLLLLSPGGRQFNQTMAYELAATAEASGGFSLLCGRYEGVDHRVRQHLCDGEVSIGDVVLSGGEVGACVIIEAVTRLLDGAMGNAARTVTESFGESGLLEEPQFTRPAEFRGWAVPDVLRSGDHGRVERWRRAQRLHRTLRERPDLVPAELDVADQKLLEEFPPVPYS